MQTSGLLMWVVLNPHKELLTHCELLTHNELITYIILTNIVADFFSLLWLASEKIPTLEYAAYEYK